MTTQHRRDVDDLASGRNDGWTEQLLRDRLAQDPTVCIDCDHVWIAHTDRGCVRTGCSCTQPLSPFSERYPPMHGFVGPDDGPEETVVSTNNEARPTNEAAERLRTAALCVIEAQEAVRNAINGIGHLGEPHDKVLGGIYDMGEGVQLVDEVGGCAACGGAQYGSEDELNRAYGRLRAALGLEVRPWEYPDDAVLNESAVSRG